MNLASMLPDGIRKFGEYEQLIYLEDDKKIVKTNVQIDKRARGLAAGLIRQGVGRGDIVGVMLSNVPEIPEVMNGINRMGGVFLPITYMLTPPEIQYILKDSGCKVVITEEKLWPKFKEALEGKNAVEKVIMISTEDIPETIAYEGFIKADDDSGEVVDLGPEDLAILMYTSGTTGFPKGVMLAHSNLMSSIRQGQEVWTYDDTDRFLCVLPMNHIFGIIGFNEVCMTGGSCVLVPWFDPEAALDMITDYKTTVAGLVPTMIQMMMEKFNPDRHDLKSMKVMASAGAPLAEETLRKAEKMFGINIYHGYGCTEAGPTIARQRMDSAMKFGSVGPQIPGLELLLLDDEGNEVPQGSDGEIVVKGPGIMKGYLNKPKETAEVLKDGWLYTGDLGRLDEDGELYIVGRKKDLIIKAGENIDPGVSENILYKHDSVLEAAVIPIPDAKYGEEVGAAVVLKPGKKITEAELIDYLNEHLHHFVAPKRVFFMEDLPKTTSGKIQKNEIKKIIDKIL